MKRTAATETRGSPENVTNPYLLWIPQGLSKHLLDVSHDGYFLMSFERIFNSLRGRSPLQRKH